MIAQQGLELAKKPATSDSSLDQKFDVCNEVEEPLL